MTRFSLLAPAALLALPLVAGAAFAQGHPAIKRPFDLPPAAELHYLVKARQGGFTIDGNNTMKWQVADRKYTIRTETRATILGKILTAGSDGGIDDYGLAPDTFTEKRVRRTQSTASFDRAAKTINLTASTETYPILGGEQDRSSIVWQLIANARAAPKKFAAGSEWRYFVVGQQHAEAWTFKVGKSEKIDTAMGQFNAVKVSRVPASERSQLLDIWLAPELDWYPVRLRYTEPEGDYIEQTLERVSGK